MVNAQTNIKYFLMSSIRNLDELFNLNVLESAETKEPQTGRRRLPSILAMVRYARLPPPPLHTRMPIDVEIRAVQHSLHSVFLPFVAPITHIFATGTS